MGIVVTGLILLIKFFFGRVLTPRWHYFIWMLLIIRLLIPVAPEASVSIYNYLPFVQEHYHTENIETLSLNELLEQADSDSSQAPGVDVQEQSPETESTDEDLSSGRDLASGSDLSSKEQGEKDSSPGVHQDEVHRGSDSSSSSISINSNSITRIFSLGFEEISRIWLLGVLVFSGIFVFSYYKLKYNIKKHEVATDKNIMEIVNKSKTKLGFQGEIKVISTNSIKTPFVLGVSKPKLVLPENLTEYLSNEEIEYIILHELSHIKQKDVAIIWVSTILQILHWFNPVIWYAFSKMRRDCEFACDEYVMYYLNSQERKQYGHTILNVLNGIANQKTLPGTTGIANNKSDLVRRVKMISNFKRPTVKLSVIAISLIVLTGCIGLSGPSDGLDADDTVPIPDEVLEKQIREELEIEDGEDITKADMKELTRLNIPESYEDENLKKDEPPRVDDSLGEDENVEKDENLEEDDSPEDDSPKEDEYPEDLTGLEYASNLEVLHLHGDQITDLSPLEDLENLSSVGFYGAEIDDLSPLFGNENLSMLFLTETNLDDENVEQIASNFPKLTWLIMNKNHITDISPLQNLENLSLLSIAQNGIQDISSIESLDGLNTLILNSNPIDDLSALAELEELSTLAIDNLQIEDLSYIEGLTNLGSLHANENEIHDFTPLENLDDLNVLHLSDNRISDYQALEEMDNLEDLNLADNPIGVEEGSTLEIIDFLDDDDMNIELTKSYDEGDLFVYQSNDNLKVAMIELENGGFQLSRHELTHHEEVDPEKTFSGRVGSKYQSVSEYYFHYSWIFEEDVDSVILETSSGEVEAAVSEIDGEYFWGKLLPVNADLPTVVDIE